VQTSDFAGDAQTVVADGKLIRDARLERYFAAHKQFGGSSALGVPSGFLRAATTQTPDR
jgi:sigma-E factor negative regulatory protein RseA